MVHDEAGQSIQVAASIVFGYAGTVTEEDQGGETIHLQQHRRLVTQDFSKHQTGTNIQFYLRSTMSDVSNCQSSTVLH